MKRINIVGAYFNEEGRIVLKLENGLEAVMEVVKDEFGGDVTDILFHESETSKQEE